MAKFFQLSLEQVSTIRDRVRKAISSVGQGLVALAVFAFIALPLNVAQAEITAKISVTDKKTYGRIVFRFFELPPYKVKISDGVLIISFEDTIKLTIEQFMKPLSEFFTVGRMDPDGKSVRFALAKKIDLHTIEAGERLFIDLLPRPWVGLPPSLPQHVIDEMSAKNRMKDEETRKLVRRAAFKKSKKTLKLRVGQYPTFSRLVFDWTEKVGVRVSRSDSTLNIQFDKLIKVDITRLKVDPPKFVAGAKSKLTDDGLEVDIMLREGTSIRAFREGFAYIVDVSGPLDEEEKKQRAQETTRLPLAKDNAFPALTTKPRSEVVEFEAERSPMVSVKSIIAPSTPKKMAGVEGPAVKKPVMKKPPMKKPAVEVSSKKKMPEPLVAKKGTEKKGETAKSVIDQVVRKSESGQAKAPQMVVNKISKSGGISTAVKARSAAPKSMQSAPALAHKKIAEKEKKKSLAAPSTKPANTRKSKSLKVAAAVVSGNVVLKFPFPKDVPAAVFQRGGTLWAVFDTHLKLDLSALGNGKEKFDRIAGYSTIRTQNNVVVLLRLDRPSLTTAARQGNGWLLTIGDFIVTPVKPVKLIPGEDTGGLNTITMTLKKPARLNVYEDPQIGDVLAVVTAFGPPQGVIKSQSYVEFRTIATAHGIAIQSSVDDLKVNVNSDNVVVTRDQGLLLSVTSGQEGIRSSRAAIDITRPGKIDFERWAQGGVVNFDSRRAELEREIASKTNLKMTIAARIELARLYVGNQLGAEALGTMEILKAIDPKVENDPLFHALRGVANLMMHRLSAARFDLTTHGLLDDKDAQLWLGLLDVAEGNWVQARLNFSKGEASMKHYPEEIKALFRIKAARANIEVNDISSARFQLAAMPKINLKRKYTAEAAFLNGRLLELLGRNEEALDFYNEALSYGDRMVEAETSFFKTMLEYRLGRIKAVQALEQLEGQLIVWRGDEVELKVMRELAKLYVAQNSFRRGLETMRTAATYYPDEKIGRLIQDDMVVLFNELFLGEKLNLMPPIKALSLYYDFRELTPIGRLGDEMIRRLSDTLISVDLLDQAAEILAHQVDKRLKGAARAQVATKLAMVHMFRRQPQKALTAIRRTRQAILPKKVSRRRSLMEARALAELGRFESAINLLANLEGRDVELARAATFWLGKKWQNAGEAYERILGKAWKQAAALSRTQRIDVLRAAISYTLAEDKLGSDRLREKFASKMAQSADAQTFEVITASHGGREAEFRDIVKKIASIDTLKGFLEEFRKAEIPLSSDAQPVPQS